MVKRTPSDEADKKEEQQMRIDGKSSNCELDLESDVNQLLLILTSTKKKMRLMREQREVEN